MLPDWLLPTFILVPATLLMFLGVGLPWALVLLPRSDWRRWPIVIGVGMALGPLLSTTIIFFIGTFARFSAPNVLAATIILALIGAILALRTRPTLPGEHLPEKPLTMIDLALIVVIAVAVLLRYWNTAYWPFSTYDEFWVYGYNARVFLLEGAIPRTMGYYPQFVPLTYTYNQLIWNLITGAAATTFNDHAARVVLPYLALASILMAYIFGARLFNRRVGLLAAALWALYPHHAAWSQFGDLEVPVTLYFTGTAAFFALGWKERQPRYIVLAGLMMGGALWTKPTAGGLIQSAILIGATGFLSTVITQRGRFANAIRCALQTPAVRYALMALLVAFPIGGMWYIRNVALGHPPLILPEGYWQDESQRSGQELGWPLLIAGASVAAFVLRASSPGARKAAALGGLVLMLAGSLPSAFGGRFPTIDEFSRLLTGQIVPFAPNAKMMRLGFFEYGLIGVGALLLGWAVFPAWRTLPERLRGAALVIAAFIVPYFLTWFWSYSYHFRLSFPIVPIMIVPLAALIEASTSRLTLPRLLRPAVILLTVALALPGWWAVLTALEPAALGTLPTDDARMANGNPALMALVNFLRDRRAQLGRPMKVVAPGELRLNFFFPEDDIRGDLFPLTLDEIAALDFYIENSAGERIYSVRGLGYNQIYASRTRKEAMHRVFAIDDGDFRFSVYTPDNVTRFRKPQPNGKINVQIGDFAFFWGHDLSTLRQHPGENLYLTLWWEALKPADADYSVFIHLWDPVNKRVGSEWSGQPVSDVWSVWENVPGVHFSVPYPTRLWQKGEIIMDEWKIAVDPKAPFGHYELRIGLFDPIRNERLPVFKDGVVIGDSVLLNELDIVP